MPRQLLMPLQIYPCIPLGTVGASKGECTTSSLFLLDMTLIQRRTRGADEQHGSGNSKRALVPLLSLHLASSTVG